MNELFTPAAISVSELNAIAKTLLETHFQGFWVSGEVSNLTRAASGHYYFSLKDQGAQVRCAMFKFAAARLSAPLKEGDHIEVSGKISIYEARGEFQISVNEVRQVGLGRLFERYEKLKQQLQAEGLFAPERKQMLPENPRTIGLVTSLAAAALRDVLTTLRRRAPHIPVVIYPTPVQGAGSEKQVAAAIEAANARAEVDVLIVCRGGGSIEDLWAFNEEVAVRAIAASKLPIVSGVGHETDFTLSDFAADVRAPTPTAAAELVSPNRAEFIQRVNSFQAALTYFLRQYYENAVQKTDFLAQKLVNPRQNLRVQQQQLQQQQHLLRYALRNQIQAHKQQLAQLNQTVRHAKPDVAQQKVQLQRFQAGLNQAAQQFFRQQQTRVARQSDVLEAVSPQRILQRGFAVVQDSRGKVVQNANALKAGQKLSVILAEGRADVQVVNQQGQKELF
ncbi:exodeoxyribonuclease VII large subunit [Neisseriaceae bacterium B1]